MTLESTFISKLVDNTTKTMKAHRMASLFSPVCFTFTAVLINKINKQNKEQQPQQQKRLSELCPF